MVGIKSFNNSVNQGPFTSRLHSLILSFFIYFSKFH